jgi:NADPH-dependent 2,4-dienoyl-CoA reductase/sulfur reductase-like enzyme
MGARHTVIIGNGIAGTTTARHLRKADSHARITMISGESEYFFSRTALMYVYMGHMKWEQIHPYENWFWEKNRIDLIQAWVDRIDYDAKLLHFSNGNSLPYDNLVLATGSKPAFYGWPGQDLKGVQGLFSYQDLQLLEANTPAPGEKEHPCRHAVISGGGLIGVELAEMLLTRGVKVTMLVREGHFWGNVITRNESEIIAGHMKAHGVNLIMNTELNEITGDENGKVKSITCKNGDVIECQLVGITTGVKPNVEFLQNTDLELNRGILVNEYLETNIPDVYAAGDCAEIRNPLPGRRAIEPVWYTGRMMGEVLGLTLSGKRSVYKPGPWFNSAKFFDIEYQTYGEVRPKPAADQAHFFWRKPETEKFITITYHPESHLFQGINAYGIRLRHAYFDDALRKKHGVAEVVGRIEAANFDTEFYKGWTSTFKASFAESTGIAIKELNTLQRLFRK